MPSVLLVEDDCDLASSLREFLQGEGFEIIHVDSGQAALDTNTEQFDVIILDWMLPDVPGIDVLRAWRAEGRQQPVVWLTARSELVDRVLGLEMGANDYIVKPFQPRELLARLRVQLRGRHSAPSTHELTCGPLEIDLKTREVRFESNSVELCRQEFALLKLLAESPNQVFSREEILNQAWGYDVFPSTRTVDTHVLQIRQKTRGTLIETVRGIGYRLRIL